MFFKFNPKLLLTDPWTSHSHSLPLSFIFIGLRADFDNLFPFFAAISFNFVELYKLAEFYPRQSILFMNSLLHMMFYWLASLSFWDFHSSYCLGYLFWGCIFISMFSSRRLGTLFKSNSFTNFL